MSEYSITVYRYGLLPPLDWGEDCDAQMDLMRELWNVLVKIDTDARDETRSIAARNPEVADLTAKFEAARDAEVPDKQVVRDAVAALRVASKAAYADAKDELAAIETARREKVKAARQGANLLGCWWSNANAVIADYGTASARARKEGAELRKRDRSRERVVNQVQGGITPLGLFEGKNNICRVLIGEAAQFAWHRPVKPRNTVLTATVYCRGREMRRTVSWPMIMDRPFPDGAIVQQVEVVKRSVADRRHGVWQATFVLRIPRVDGSLQRLQHGLCGIDVGWRIEDDRSVRVAAIVSTLSNEPRIIRMPPKVLRRADALGRLAGERAEHFERGLADFRAIDWTKAPGELAAAAREMYADLIASDKQVTPAALRRFVLLWSKSYSQWRPDLLPNLASWRVEDGLLWRTPLLQSRHLRGWRKSLYGEIASQLCKTHAVIAVEKPFIARIVKGKAGDGLNRVRFLSRLASPAELVSALKNAARKWGTRIVEYEGESSFVCNRCGARTDVKDKTELWFTCGGCGAVHDQDVNAARNLLAVARASAPIEQETSVDLAPRATRRREGLARAVAARREEKQRALANDGNYRDKSTDI